MNFQFPPPTSINVDPGKTLIMIYEFYDDILSKF